MAEPKQVRPDRLDPEALAVAVEAVQREVWIAVRDNRLSIEDLTAAAINGYLGDLIRQLDLRPCEDCNEEDQDDTDRVQDANA